MVNENDYVLLVAFVLIVCISIPVSIVYEEKQDEELNWITVNELGNDQTIVHWDEGPNHGVLLIYVDGEYESKISKLGGETIVSGKEISWQHIDKDLTNK